MSKILVGCPVHESKMYCLEDWIVHVQMMKGDFDIFVSDNSQSFRVKKLLKKHKINHDHVSPKNKSLRQTMSESHNSVRQYFLDGNYSHLLHLECDVFPPLSAIPNLLFYNKEVISIPYMVGEGEQRHVLIQEIEDSYFNNERDIIKYNSLSDVFMMDGEVKQVFASGIGCTLISRSVLEKIIFRHDPKLQVFPDSFFYYDLHRLKIPAFIDTSMICDHRNKEYLPLTPFVY